MQEWRSQAWADAGRGMTRGQAARALEVSGFTVQRWAVAGFIRSVRRWDDKQAHLLYCRDDVLGLAGLLGEQGYGPRVRSLRVLRRLREPFVVWPEQRTGPDAVVLARAVELVCAAYGEAMRAAGLLSGKVTAIHALAASTLDDALSPDAETGGDGSGVGA